MSKVQPTIYQTKREQHLKNRNPFEKNEFLSKFNSSEESLSSDNEDMFTPPLPILKRNLQYLRQRNTSVEHASKKKKRPCNSRLKKRKSPKYISPLITQTVLHIDNQPSTLIYLPPSKNDYNVHHFWGQPVSYVESANDSENLSSVSHSKPMKFHKNSKPSHHTSVAFNYPTFHNCKIKECCVDTFQSANQPSCCSTTLSTQTTSSRTHNLILHCIRNCQTPLNIYRAPDISTTPCQCMPYFQLNFPVSQCTLNNYSSSEELENVSTVYRSTTQSSSPYPLFCISPIETFSQTSSFSSPISASFHSIPQDISSLDGTEVECLETTPENITILSSKTELRSNVPPISTAFESTCRESWRFKTETENIDQSSRCPLNSYETSLKKNFIYPKSALENRGDSLSSNVIKVGTMETLENKTSLSYKAEPTSNTPPKNLIFQTTSKHHLYNQDGAKYVRQSSCCPLNSNYFPLKENSTYSKSASERNLQNHKEMNSLKSSVSRVKKESTLELQRNNSSNSTSFSLDSNKHIQNASVSINQPLSCSEIPNRHFLIRNSNDSRAVDLFLEENDQFTLNSNYFSSAPFLYPEESFSVDAENLLAPPNTPNSISSSEERCFTENTVGSKSWSFASLSMMCDPPTKELSKVSVLFKKPPIEHNNHSRNKTKKSKFVYCFIACFRPCKPSKK